MISTRVSGGLVKIQGHRAAIVAFLQLAVLLAVADDSTVIPRALLGDQYAWRVTLLCLSAGTVALWLTGPVRISKRVWSRMVLYTALLVGPYVCLLLAESANAMFSSVAPFTVRTIYLRMFTILPAMASIFLAAGGGLDVAKGLRFLLRPYLFLALYISVTGILVWFLLQFQIVGWNDWSPPSELSAKINRKGGANLYSMPLYLGFALVGASDDDSLGTFRISGLSPEPNSAALFVTPALFAVPLVFGRRKLLSAAAIGSILGFLFLAYSVTNVLGLLVIAGLVALRYLTRTRHSRRIPYFVTIVALVSVLYVSFGAYVLQSGRVDFIRSKSSSISALATLDAHQTITSTDALIGRGLFRDYGNTFGQDLEVGLLSATTFWMQAIVLLLAGCLLFFSRRATYPLGLAVVYVVFHSMKDPQHVLGWPIYIFMMAIAVLAMSAPSERRQKGPVAHSEVAAAQ